MAVFQRAHANYAGRFDTGVVRVCAKALSQSGAQSNLEVENTQLLYIIKH